MNHRYWRFFLIMMLFAKVGFVAASSELIPVKLQLKWLHQFQFAGYYASVEKGFYKDVGLDVTLIAANAELDPVSEVMSGNADFGVGTSELLLRRAQGEKVVVLGVIFQYSPLVLIAKRDKVFKTLYDIMQQPIAIESGSSEIVAYLKSRGIEVHQVEIEGHDFYIEKLIKGEIAAQTAYTTTEPYLMDQLGIEYQLFSPRSVGIDFYGDNLFTTEAMIANRPQRVRAFKAASLKGWEYAMTHPEEIIELIKKKYSPHSSVEALRYEAQEMAHLMKVDVIHPGYMNEGRWQSIVNVYTEAKMLPNDFELDPFLYSDTESPIDLTPYYIAIGLFFVVLLVALGTLIYIFRIKKQLMHSRHNYQNMLELAPLPFIVLGKDKGICEWNQAAQQLFGWQKDEILGCRITRLFDDEPVHDNIEKALKSALERKSFISQVNNNTTQSGETIQCLWHIGPRYNLYNQVDGVICIVKDMTESAKLERALKQSKEDAEQTLADHQQFLSMASHEFRTPLAIISQNVQLILLHMKNNQPIPQKVLDRINRAITRTTEFMDKVYIADRFNSDAWQLNASEIVLSQLFESVLEEHHSLFPARTIVFQNPDNFEKCMTVYWDGDLIQVALNNLLSNAIKYSPDDLDITLSVSRTDEGIKIVVRDQGDGIDAKLQNKLFGKYVRSNKVSGTTGTGMGLYIVNHIVTLHHGTISLLNHPEGGLEVSVLLPFRV
ncbi:hypothetical protein CYQ88_10620 [Hydrogenovibrio sp. SC-1]|uniref:ABC transporter substrate-binding protein n=1 Tax=Hydrogenovibrio sp. SC-1 TaxID=2065820 RepID=UPI000C7BBF09|nr:ABC transporter substrate-binding protein [Hydrogenovibrio sp. SC-1]PLA73552.1 hypothetical protein CYQ88_10620 [Hydrogenovibrio sp. SC-1]